RARCLGRLHPRPKARRKSTAGSRRAKRHSRASAGTAGSPCTRAPIAVHSVGRRDDGFSSFYGLTGFLEPLERRDRYQQVTQSPNHPAPNWGTISLDKERLWVSRGPARFG